MKRRIVMIMALCGVVALAAYLLSRQRGVLVAPFDKGFSSLEGAEQSNRPSAQQSKQVISGTNGGLGRFVAEVLPVAEEFGRRARSVGAPPIALPFELPIQTNRITRIRFAGGASNTLCTFIIDRHTVMGYHFIRRNGKEHRGIHYFGRAGKDENGMPYNQDRLLAEPGTNEAYIRQLGDTNLFPVLDLKSTAVLTQQLLAALRPNEAHLYHLEESWREGAGANALPFYTFTFPRKGLATTDPYNRMRDEVMITLKSTKSGLVLDFYEDLSIAFLGKPRSPQ